jgi:hypothetical protein
MNPLNLIRLAPLMDRTSGKTELKIGLIDGPVAMNHPELASERIREIPGTMSGVCTQTSTTACLHGTFVAGILCAKRNSSAPAICPNCTLLIRPIFTETTSGDEPIPSATPQELAAAIIECVEAGVRVINLSLALAQPSTKGERELDEALDHASRRGVIVVGSSSLLVTRVGAGPSFLQQDTEPRSRRAHLGHRRCTHRVTRASTVSSGPTWMTTLAACTAARRTRSFAQRLRAR